MSNLSDFKISVSTTPTRNVAAIADEDPLSTVASPKVGVKSFDLNTMLSGDTEEDLTQNGIENYEQNEVHDEENNFDDDDEDYDSISFELYEDGFVREKFIEQIRLDIGDAENIDRFDISKFLLDHYKYRDLGDMSSGLSGLVGDIENELIENVNQNYLSFINLGKSIDGSFDLIHDIKIDLSEYLKNLRLSNEGLEKDSKVMEKSEHSRVKLNKLKNDVKNIITASEMIECFDKLCLNFSYDVNSIDNIKEMSSLYFGINKVFESLNFSTTPSEVVKTLNKKMNDLKLEFRSLVSDYVNHLKNTRNKNEELFEAFKIFQLIKFTDRF